MGAAGEADVSGFRICFRNESGEVLACADPAPYGPEKKGGDMSIVMLIAKGLGLTVVVGLCVLAWLTLVPWRSRWIRMWDYPRGQILILLILTVPGVGYWVCTNSGPLGYGLSMLTVSSIVLLCWEIFPYTTLSRKETPTASATGQQNGIRLLSSNVLMENRDYGRLCAYITQESPDVLVVLEVDPAWLSALASVTAAYPHRFEHPLDNRYGMAIYSRFAVRSGGIRFLLRDDLPSAKLELVLPDDRLITLYVVHPPPPAPGEAPDSIARDAELAIIAQEAHADPHPSIVLGDLNDVAWSHSTRLFQRLGTMCDPRIGRGMFNSYHAGHWWMRWPLDHVFLSPHFSLQFMHLGPAIGSDHFPVVVDCVLESTAVGSAPRPQAKDAEESQRLIAYAHKHQLPLSEDE